MSNNPIDKTARRPRIGVGVLVRNGEGKILLGKRKGSHGEDSWQFPGGHLEAGESVTRCAIREVMEECGIAIKALTLGPFTEDHFEEDGLHYITLYVQAESPDTPRVMEPEKCAGWSWFSENRLPEPLFLPIRNLLARYGSLDRLPTI